MLHEDIFEEKWLALNAIRHLAQLIVLMPLVANWT